jgi:phospholipid/cholesterol/gamma-HCH transport system substrate-binding protein
VSYDGDGASIAVDLYPDMVPKIPANVTAVVVPPTLFGSKYVVLQPIPGAIAGHIKSAAVISRTDVTVEANQAFDAVMSALSAMPPSELNVALNSTANTLAGRGQQLGSLIQQADLYFRQLNPSVPLLTHTDIPALADVAGVYRQVTPDLINTADNVGAESRTFKDARTELAAMLAGLTNVGDTGSQFFSTTLDPLPDAVSIMRPTLSLLDRYSPVFKCVIQGAARLSDQETSMLDEPPYQLRLNGTISVAEKAYAYPSELPKVNAQGGPDCHGLPNITGPIPLPHYDTGADRVGRSPQTIGLGRDPLAAVLFGKNLPLGQSSSIPGGKK